MKIWGTAGLDATLDNQRALLERRWPSKHTCEGMSDVQCMCESVRPNAGSMNSKAEGRIVRIVWNLYCVFRSLATLQALPSPQVAPSSTPALPPRRAQEKCRKSRAFMAVQKLLGSEASAQRLQRALRAATQFPSATAAGAQLWRLFMQCFLTLELPNGHCEI